MFGFQIISPNDYMYSTKKRTMEIKAIKPGPKPITNDGDLDERRRVSPPNVPKFNPPLKPHKPKPKK